MRFITNVQNICKLQTFTNKLDKLPMRKLLIICLLFTLFSCEKNDPNDILPNVPVDVIVDLNLPQYIDLQTPSGWVYTSGGIKGVFIQNTGIGSPPFKAFERACPNYDCNSPMVFDGSLKFKCPCDNSEYSVIDGSPQTAGNTHFAREYRVLMLDPSTLNITNF
jgi:nitrite reductase/ring-hydroxylating ferredoxin subunit